jgi:hypothetical protein
MSTLRPGPRPGLIAEQLVERGEPMRMYPRRQVFPRRRHPGQHRLHQEGQLGAGPIPPLRSLPSLWSPLHWRLLGPGVGDRCLGRPRFSGRPGSRRYSVRKFNRRRDISGQRPVDGCSRIAPGFSTLKALRRQGVASRTAVGSAGYPGGGRACVEEPAGNASSPGGPRRGRKRSAPAILWSTATRRRPATRGSSFPSPPGFTDAPARMLQPRRG